MAVTLWRIVPWWDSGQLCEVERVEECGAGMLDVGDERGLLQLVARDLLGPGLANDTRDPVELGFVDNEARINALGVGDDA